MRFGLGTVSHTGSVTERVSLRLALAAKSTKPELERERIEPAAQEPAETLPLTHTARAIRNGDGFEAGAVEHSTDNT